MRQHQNNWLTRGQTNTGSGCPLEYLVRAVRLAINRLHDNLAAATDGNGQPHPVLRPFAEHLAKHPIAPSARFNGRMGARTRAGGAGRFTYEPPEGVVWSR